MPRPTKKIEIPMRTIQGILDLKELGWSHAEIGQYFGVSQDTISRRIREYQKTESPQ